MKKEDLLSDDFLKQFKTGDELYGFLAELQKRGIEKMLEGELDAHLGYEKHDRKTTDNVPNGTSSKKISLLSINQKCRFRVTERPLLIPFWCLKDRHTR